MTDTHTHLYMPDSFAADAADAVGRALESGVSRMIFPAVDPETFPALLGLHSKFPSETAFGVAIHPTELTPGWREDLRAMLDQAAEAGVCPVAVGETGMDLYWDKSGVALQREAFHGHLELAFGLGLPVIIHCREALRETLDVIRRFKEGHGGELPELIFHSFTGTADDVREIRRTCDPYFGINGVVTFKNARGLPEAVKEIGVDRLLLETDSPYLAPVPHRGKRNESSYLPLIRDRIAAILSLRPEEIEQATDYNAKELFG